LHVIDAGSRSGLSGGSPGETRARQALTQIIQHVVGNADLNGFAQLLSW
jgi:hypothetical protein